MDGVFLAAMLGCSVIASFFGALVGMLIFIKWTGAMDEE